MRNKITPSPCTVCVRAPRIITRGSAGSGSRIRVRPFGSARIRNVPRVIDKAPPPIRLKTLAGCIRHTSLFQRKRPSRGAPRRGVINVGLIHEAVQQRLGHPAVAGLCAPAALGWLGWRPRSRS